MFSSLEDAFTLNNGVRIPCVGFGTYLAPAGEVCFNAVTTALECGYRHIDTASVYGNEDSVGAAVAASGVPRAEVFITTKLWNDDQGYSSALAACEKSLSVLGTDYADLYLIHWPIAHRFRESYPERFLESWRALESLYAEGKARAIGVCNCLENHLKLLLDNCTVKPMVDQIEYHIGCRDIGAEKLARDNGIIAEAWAPLCRGRAFGTEPLRSIAAAHAKTEAQVLIRWCLQHGALPLPKSVNPPRIKENAEVFDFCLSAAEIEALDAVSGISRVGSHPDSVKF